MDNQNYLMLNGVKIQLTPEQLEQLKSGIKPQVDFSDYNETDWFYYKFGDNDEWLSKNAFGRADSFCLQDKHHGTDNPNGLCKKENVIEFRRPTKEEMETLYKHYPQYKPKIKWEDFGKVKGYYVSGNCIIVDHNSPSQKFNTNVFPTREEAEACLALSQLLQWRNKYNEGWKPDWENGSEPKYVIYFQANLIYLNTNTHTSSILSFKTKEIRDKFLEDFRDLIKIVRPLL